MTASPLLDALGEIMRARRSCRAFRPEPVPRGTLDALVRMAQQSPSWCNVQPWELVITEGEATRRMASALTEHVTRGDPAQPDLPFPREYKGVYLERRRACGWALYESVGIKKGDRDASTKQNMRNFSFFDAPHVAILSTTEELGVYGAVDCGVYLGHLLLAAESLGLGAIAQAAPAVYSPFLHRHLAIPDDRQIVCAIALGFPDHEHPSNSFRTQRAPIEHAVRFVR